MRKIMFASLTGALLVLPGMALAQSGAPAPVATDITKAEIDKLLENAPPAVDQQIKIVDMGKYNLAVGVIHRGPTNDKSGDPIRGPLHTQVAETYIVISGSGTLTTGGEMTDITEAAPDSMAVTVLNGPTSSGVVHGGVSRVVSAGDVIIIPPNTFHGWSQIADHVTYLSVRPDPDKILPAGYVNPLLGQ